MLSKVKLLCSTCYSTIYTNHFSLLNIYPKKIYTVTTYKHIYISIQRIQSKNAYYYKKGRLLLVVRSHIIVKSYILS